MRLWIDDVREPPSEDWVWAKCDNEAFDALITGEVVEVSFDNDLGLNSTEGWEIANVLERWVRERRIDAPERLRVHSGNPAGRDRIFATLCAIQEFADYKQ